MRIDLDAEAILWKQEEKTGNLIEAQKHWNAIWVELFGLSNGIPKDYKKADKQDIEWKNSEDYLGLILEVQRKFDPAKGEFTHFFNYLREKRKKDWNKRNYGVEDNYTSLDDISDRMETGDSFASAKERELLNDRRSQEKMESAEAFDKSFADLTAMILHFWEHHQGKNANELRRNWYRIFYTEDITYMVQSTLCRFNHERDVFAAMKLPYLDYFMENICRTLTEVQKGRLKPYGLVVPECSAEDKDKETKLPLPADVSLAYLERCEGKKLGRPARSNQFKYYKMERESLGNW